MIISSEFPTVEAFVWQRHNRAGYVPEDPTVEAIDDRQDYGGQRIRAIGEYEGWERRSQKMDHLSGQIV